jgi:hypothetical protein
LPRRTIVLATTRERVGGDRTHIGKIGFRRLRPAPASGPPTACGLLSESIGSGKTISCPTEWRSRRGPVMVRGLSRKAESLA